MNETTTLPTFCHLHIHSEYSLTDGAIPIHQLVSKIKSLGHSSVALTDHANMFGAIEFYQACRGQGIKPIMGCEIFHEATDEIQQILASEWSEPGKDALNLVLLAKTTEGYHNLMRVVSYGYLHGSSQLPRVPTADLISQSQDLIALSAGARGGFGRLVRQLSLAMPNLSQAWSEPSTEAQPILKALQSHVDQMEQIYGKGHYYVEIQDNQIPGQREFNQDLVVCARMLNLPLVATSNSYYLEEDFAKAHAVLVGIRNELTLSKMRDRRKDVQFHVFNNEEMTQRFAEWPEALENTLKIADTCQVELKFGQFFLPDFDTQGLNIDAYLIEKAKQGLSERLEFLRNLYGPEFDTAREQTYWQRLDYELGVIIKMGFPGYFLIVQDFINWAKNQDIPVGPGRGSGAGSIVAYALKITDLDPIHLNLIFERFLNPERISMPDFDVDFCQARRDEVIQYVTKKYNSSNVAQITTFGKLKAKAALRDVGRVLEVNYSRVDKIAKLIPNDLDITLEKALQDEPKIQEEADNDQLIQDMIDISRKLENMCRHTSVHAAGVVISNGPMENYVPVYKTEDNFLITQYEMKNAEKVGLVKFDFLGLKTLTVIKKAVDIIRSNRDPNFNIETINVEDQKTFRDISTGNTCAIFQLESPGMQALNMKLKPSCFEDIIAVVALFRPGPLQSGMVDDFIERKHGRQDIVFPVPELEEILKETYGIILYQEQVQKIAATLAHYSLGEADLLRRAMGKKKPEEMAKQKSRFISGCIDNKIDPKIADDLFELMAKFAAYGFNKSHSAAYGLVSYQTAYLKSHYPEEFMAAIMTCDMDNTDKLSRYIEECRRMRFKIMAPDINHSMLEFSVVEPGVISFALSAIKGIGTGSIEALVQNRQQKGAYQSLTDLAHRIDLHKVGKKTLELLNEAGALDRFAMNRAQILTLIPDLVKYSASHHEAKSVGQMSLFDAIDHQNGGEANAQELAMKSSEVDYDPLSWLMKENKALGVFISQHPCQLFNDDLDRFSRLKIKDIAKSVGQRDQTMVCYLIDINETRAKNGKPMVHLRLEDETGRIAAVLFDQDIPKELPPAGTLVFCCVSISKSYDGQKLRLKISRLCPLEEARGEILKAINISIDAKAKNSCQIQPLLTRLKSFLGDHPGSTPVRLVLEFDKSKVYLKPDQLTIAVSDHAIQGLKYFNSRVSMSYY